MSKAKDSESKDLVVVDFSPTLAIPDDAPPMQLDPQNPMLSYDDLFPSNYFSMEDLDIWLKERGADARLLTVTGASVEYVFDPEKGEKSGDHKPCLHFAETATLLVLNKTRGQQLRGLTRSPFLKDWANVGKIAIKPGIGNGKAQIIIEPAPDDDPEWAVPAEFDGEEEDINEVLFG